MRKNPVLATILSIMFLILSVLAMILPGRAGEITEMFLLPLFFVLLCGILTGPVLPMAVGFLSPLVAFLIKGSEAFSLEVLPFMLLLMAAGLISGLVFTRMGTSVGAAVSGMLSGVIIYAVTKLLASLSAGISYKVTDLAKDAFLRVWPGILICAVGVPLFILFLRKIGIMNVLTDENNAK